MDEIILKYLKGEMLIEDQHKLSKWLDEDPKNRRTLRKIDLYWNSADASTRVAKGKVWLKLVQEIEEDGAIQKSSPSKTRYLTRYSVAAAVALFVAASFVIARFAMDNTPQNLFSADYIEKVCPPGMKMPIQFVDGSVVQLNSGSSIRYPNNFSGDKREIILKGEAFFDVVRDESKPFVIQTPGMRVRVLGTSFNVQAYEDEPFSEVAVKSGRVRVTSANGQAIDITKSEKAALDKDGAVLASSAIENPDAAFGWMEGRLVFEDVDLETALRKVGRWYGVSISYNNLKQPDKKITSNCKDCTIQEIMESLSYSYDFEYAISGNSITINE